MRPARISPFAKLDLLYSIIQNEGHHYEKKLKEKGAAARYTKLPSFFCVMGEDKRKAKLQNVISTILLYSTGRIIVILRHCNLIDLILYGNKRRNNKRNTVNSAVNARAKKGKNINDDDDDDLHILLYQHQIRSNHNRRRRKYY
jgi:hypothetical protein